MLIKFQLKSNLQANKLLHSNHHSRWRCFKAIFVPVFILRQLPFTIEDSFIQQSLLQLCHDDAKRQWSWAKCFSSLRRSHSLASLAKIIWMEKLLSRRHENIFFLFETPRSLAGNVNGTVSCFFVNETRRRSSIVCVWWGKVNWMAQSVLSHVNCSCL